MSNTPVSAGPSISLKKPLPRPLLVPRRTTCSFLEPILEQKRSSSSGKPYSPLRTKSPAPEDMINGVNSLRRPATARTNSMPVRTDSFRRRAASLFKRTNSIGALKNSTIDIREVREWSFRHGGPLSAGKRRVAVGDRNVEGRF
jgi:hypothetical protein